MGSFAGMRDLGFWRISRLTKRASSLEEKTARHDGCLTHICSMGLEYVPRFGSFGLNLW